MELTADQEIQARNIEPLHAARDQSKLDSLIQAMDQDGWTGRPILALDSGNETRALTGSHRIAAASKLDITVPVVLIPEPVADDDLETIELWEALGDATDDDDRCDALQALYDAGEIEREALDLMQEEREANS